MATTDNGPTQTSSLATTKRPLAFPGVGRTNAYSTKGELVDNKEALIAVINALTELPTASPLLYLDLEGVKLCRNGTISILQIYVATWDYTYLLDVHILGPDTFVTPGSSGQTLKSLLESDGIIKVFFDVRNDSDALFAHYGISLRGIVDLQLMELARRPAGQRRFVTGLAKCIERDAGLTTAERSVWSAGKQKGLDLFHPDRGGSYEVFETRPLSDEILAYCIEDVRLLHRLWRKYEAQLTPQWRIRVRNAALARVRESQSPSYDPNSREKARAPTGWNFI